MKKSALALAVAAALVGFGSAAYADTTLYGSARVSVDYNDVSAPDGFVDTDQLYQSSWDVYNNASRLGVRGEEDLGGGLAAIYQYEFGVDVTEGGSGFNSNRPKWVGLKGASWGSVTIGTQWTPYYNVIGIGDIFNSSKIFNSVSSIGNVNPSSPVLNTYLGNTFGLRMDNSLIYSTPNWSGFSGQVMLVMNGQCPPTDPLTDTQLRYGTACTATRSQGTTNLVPANLNDSIDMWNISASYKNGPFFAGATYMALEGDSFGIAANNPLLPPAWDGDQWGVALGYNAGPFAVSLAYEDGDLNTVYVNGAQNIYVTGQYTFGNNVIRASYGYLTPDDGRLFFEDGSTLSQGDLNSYALGYQYNFSKRTRVWFEYFGSTGDGNIYGDINGVSIGTRVDF